MKKVILIGLFLHISLFAYSHNDVIADYKAMKYKDVCLKSAVLYKNAEKDENQSHGIND